MFYKLQEILPYNTYFFGFLLTLLLNYILILTKSKHIKFTGDHNFGPQKVHKDLTPRVGGVTIVIGVFLQAILLYYIDNKDQLYLIIFGVFTFFVGFVEDIIKNIKPFLRLTLTFIISLFIPILTDVKISFLEISFLDQLLNYNIFMLIITALSLTLLCQSFNIIDGLNGLLLLNTLFILSTISLILYLVGDYELIILCFIINFSIIGLLAFNFPLGKVFLGDGGAYFLGTLTGIITIMFSQNNSLISPFASLLIILYPAHEIVRTFIRRTIKNLSSSFKPDSIHLHSLIFKMYSVKFPNYSPLVINSISSTTTLIFPLSCCIFTFIAYQNKSLLIFFIIFYLVLTEILFASLIKFLKKS